jgi:hypothetical protein
LTLRPLKLVAEADTVPTNFERADAFTRAYRDQEILERRAAVAGAILSFALWPAVIVLQIVVALNSIRVLSSASSHPTQPVVNLTITAGTPG